MNWSKGFLIFSLFVFGAALIYFVMSSYRLRNLSESEVTAEPHRDQAVESPKIGKQNIFSEAIDQTSEEQVMVESEDDVETPSDVLVDSIAESLTDESEQESQDITEPLSPEIELKVERYAKLAEILPTVKELADRKFQLTKQNESNIAEHNRQMRSYLSGEGPYPESDLDAVEEEYQATVKIIEEEVSDYYRQISDMFPELDATYEVQGFDNMILLLDREVLREYFGRKLPWDGNPDYFSSQQ